MDKIETTPGLAKHGNRYKVQVYLNAETARQLAEIVDSTGEPVGSASARLLTGAVQGTHRVLLGGD